MGVAVGITPGSSVMVARTIGIGTWLSANGIAVTVRVGDGVIVGVGVLLGVGVRVGVGEMKTVGTGVGVDEY